MPIVKYYVYQTTQRFQWDNYSNSKSTVDIIFFRGIIFQGNFPYARLFNYQCWVWLPLLVSVLENNEESINSPSLMENNRLLVLQDMVPTLELLMVAKHAIWWRNGFI